MLQPVEKPDSEDTESGDIFTKSGFCQVVTPSPLGVNRDKFLRLVADIKNRKDDYNAQLKNIILASMSYQLDDKENSERSIINELFTKEDREQNKIAQKHEETLWQARLVLEIGKILDQEEEEIAKDLAKLDNDTTELLDELQGDTPYGQEPKLAQAMEQLKTGLRVPNQGNMKKRVQAWQKLYNEGNTSAEPLLMTTSKDAADVLINAYEKDSGIPLVQITGMVLPSLLGTTEDDPAALCQTFSSVHEPILEKLATLLHQLQHQDVTNGLPEYIAEQFSELAQQWNQAIETTFPQDKHGQSPVSITIFPQRSCSSLLTQKEKNNDTNGIMLCAE